MMSATHGAPAEESGAARLSRELRYVKGIGPHHARLLGRLGLHRAGDMLFHFPRDYRDFSDERSIKDLEEGAWQSVRGTVEEVELRDLTGGRTMLGVLVRQDTDFLRALWFNQPYMQGRIRSGQRVMLSGKPRFRGGRWEMAHPRFTSIDDEPVARLLPLYPLTEGLAQHRLRRMIQTVVAQYGECVEEVFPEDLLAEYEILPIREALPQIHFPDDAAHRDAARRRFVFQELFILQLALALRKAQLSEYARAAALEATPKIDARIRRLFPFELTDDQQSAIADIARDMGKPHPMNRLLQGEVGSGKTVPAVYAMLLCVAHGHQAVLMAPTEVLARQHAETFGKYLSAARVRTAQLTGGLPARQREEALAGIVAGTVDLVIGTHAILENDIQFAKLGLAVVDEQHKFGVRQRATLRNSGTDPHYLVMTATPIPRTIHMTLFGDLEVSTIRTLPPGRQPVNTYLVAPDTTQRWWEFVRRKLREGRQAFVITPLVEPSEQLAAASVEDVFEDLANGELEAFRLGLIHGRMSSDDKLAAMRQFRSGNTQVLVSTSVVEVGVDVPNATVMTILSADRFGLAQLHQLRGRISRGGFPGFCGVLAEPRTPESRQRLQAFIDSHDGFQLAEIDFHLRGPGDLLGTRQHGLPPFRIADLRRDETLLREAREAAQRLVRQAPGLRSAPLQRIRRMVLARYGKTLELADTA